MLTSTQDDSSPIGASLRLETKLALTLEANYGGPRRGRKQYSNTENQEIPKTEGQVARTLGICPRARSE
jgi:hypothetical protein